MGKRKTKRRGHDWVRDPKTLAGRIATRMEELRFKPTYLAEKCGVSVTAVGWWLRGETKNLKLEYLFKLAKLLEVEPRWLALGADDETADPLTADALKLARQFDELKNPDLRTHYLNQISILILAQRASENFTALQYETSRVKNVTDDANTGLKEKNQPTKR